MEKICDDIIVDVIEIRFKVPNNRTELTGKEKDDIYEQIQNMADDEYRFDGEPDFSREETDEEFHHFRATWIDA